MKVKVTTYNTILGKKRFLETEKRNNHQWIIYCGKRPKYFVDLFDLQTESNVILNSLTFASKKSMEEILELINKKFKQKLSLQKAPKMSKKGTSELKDFDLIPIPEEWVDYSL